MTDLNVDIINFKINLDNYGSLVPIESYEDVPFDIKRIYYIYDVEKGVRRGFHAHKKLEQVLICVRGSVKILTKNLSEEKIFELNDPTKGLYIGPITWREMYDFSDDAVLLVLASEYYNVNDYIRNYDNFIKEIKGC